MYDPTQYQVMATKAERTQHHAQDMLVAEGLGHFTVDEVALLFTGASELDSFLTWATGPGGMEHFNSVPEDTMERTDGRSEFGVRFEFLRFQGAEWRIEAMAPLYGDYPLHRKQLLLMGNGSVVHASFKLSSVDDYNDALEDMNEADFVMLAGYRNSYGLFSYWHSLETLYYFKPRVNLRDVVTKAVT